MLAVEAHRQVIGRSGRTAKALFDIDPGLVLIGSGLALGYAYLARFLAISIGAVEAGLTRIPRSYDQSARTLGHGVTATLRHVHLPLSRAALAAAGLLVFVDCSKELPATLLLAPTGFETLATRIWSATEENALAEAGLAALVLLVVSGLLTWVLVVRRAELLD